MLQSSYSLSDLVDLSLRMPEIGAVNFNILHTVLQTMLVELGLENVRPTCHLDHPLLTRTELAKARMKGDGRRARSQDSLSLTKRDKPVEVPSASSEMEQSIKGKKPGETIEPSSSTKAQTDQEGISAEDDGEEMSSQAPESQPTEDAEVEEGKDDDGQETEGRSQDDRETTGGDEETRAVGKPPQEDKDHTRDSRKAEQAWRYTQLDSRVGAIEEGLMRLADIVDMIAEKIRKVESMKKQGGPSSAELEELKEKIQKLEATLTQIQEETKKKKGGPSSAELEDLEDRIEALEEAKVVFDQDHETLADVVKVQKDMLQEFEEIKSLGNEIKDMKNDIASKAGLKEMKEALALKGDLSLVLTKVDQTEFETAIEELGEAIGLLGIKFTKKNDEWEERCADLWKGIDSKMSRDVFDQTVTKIESRLTALMHALKTMKRVIDELLYPDSSGVTRCILCRRPAAISGHECVDAKDNPKRPHKSSGDSSDDSVNMDNFLKNVDKAMGKKPKVDGPPFGPSEETIIRIPYCSSTYRTEHNDEGSLKEPQLKLEPVSKKDGQRGKDAASKGKSQGNKLSETNTKEASQHFSNSKAEVEFSVPTHTSRLPHRKLVFTHKMLENSNRNEKQEEDSTSSSPDAESASTPSREGSSTSASTDVMNDSVRNMESFTPMRLMSDPLRREIIRSPNARHQRTPNLTLAPLYPDDSSSRDSTMSNSR